MKPGDTRSDETMNLILDRRAWESGRATIAHPRCGRLIWERRQADGPEWSGTQKTFQWVLISIERPDPEEA